MVEVFNIDVPESYIESMIQDARLPFGIQQGSKHRFLKLSNSLDGGDRKLLRHIPITCRVHAPLGWWIQFDTYKVGCERYSSSVMHTILNRQLCVDDFEIDNDIGMVKDDIARNTIKIVEDIKQLLKDKHIDKKYAKQLIKCAIPGSYIYKSRITINYQTLKHIYNQRYNHQLSWWQQFLSYFEQQLPLYNEIIKGQFQ